MPIQDILARLVDKNRHYLVDFCRYNKNFYAHIESSKALDTMQADGQTATNSSGFSLSTAKFNASMFALSFSLPFQQEDKNLHRFNFCTQ